ncbi:hypothetical protein B296_00055298 [Ensete ventricosum]|uniref:Uncharacterized protein n=1 Tax=Ensete ventricosum TaxID=4639 RepID=A0A426X663_ENSVE|nr:hypothetical protein B296_00055298 [Ensete ventricosum]
MQVFEELRTTSEDGSDETGNPVCTHKSSSLVAWNDPQRAISDPRRLGASEFVLQSKRYGRRRSRSETMVRLMPSLRRSAVALLCFSSFSRLGNLQIAGFVVYIPV